MTLSEIMTPLEGEMTGADEGVQPILLTESEIEGVEAALGSKLPADYRDFLKSFGGYLVFADSPWPNGPAETCRLSVFLGVLPRDGIVKFDPLWYLLRVREMTADQRPPEILPIAMSSGNDYFCLRLDEKGYGWIYYWDRLVQFDCSDYSGLYLLAGSFTEWMESLTISEE